MNMDRSIQRVLTQFGIAPTEVEPMRIKTGRRVWRVKAAGGEYALKWVEKEEVAAKTAAVSNYLKKRGVPVVPSLRTRKGNAYVVGKDGGSYLLFEWVSGTRPVYDDPNMLQRMTEVMAFFHAKSSGYVATGAPISDRLINLKRLYRKKSERLALLYDLAREDADPFARLFMSSFPWLSARAQWVLDHLADSPFPRMVAQTNGKPLLAHGDFSRANLLANWRGDLTVIDLDKVSMAIPGYDLARFLVWVDHDLQGFSPERFDSILYHYEKIRPLAMEEQEVMVMDMVFPHLALSLARSHYRGRGLPTLIEEFERCLKTDRNRLMELDVGPKW